MCPRLFFHRLMWLFSLAAISSGVHSVLKSWAYTTVPDPRRSWALVVMLPIRYLLWNGRNQQSAWYSSYLNSVASSAGRSPGIRRPWWRRGAQVKTDVGEWFPGATSEAWAIPWNYAGDNGDSLDSTSVGGASVPSNHSSRWMSSLVGRLRNKLCCHETNTPWLNLSPDFTNWNERRWFWQRSWREPLFWECEQGLQI